MKKVLAFVHNFKLTMGWAITSWFASRCLVFRAANKTRAIPTVHTIEIWNIIWELKRIINLDTKVLLAGGGSSKNLIYKNSFVLWNAIKLTMSCAIKSKSAFWVPFWFATNLKVSTFLVWNTMFFVTCMIIFIDVKSYYYK